MSSRSRDNIFARLNSAVAQRPPDAQEAGSPPIETLSQNEKIAKLKSLMEAVRSEVHVVDAQNWRGQLETILKNRDLKTLLYAPETKIGNELKTAWPGQAQGLPELVAYEGDIEDFKENLFDIDASITTTVGGIADTGAIILWPDKNEPRLMSLVPPIHIAVLEAHQIYNTFDEVIQMQKWSEKMPTNVILISGPSKTADIELTLAFGVHGPKELIVLIVRSQRI